MNHFKIKIKGQLSQQWAAWFENMIIDFDGENSIFSGNIKDQAALHGILNRIRDLNLTLISIDSNIK